METPTPDAASSTPSPTELVVTVTKEGIFYVARSENPELGSQAFSVTNALMMYAQAYSLLHEELP